MAEKKERVWLHIDQTRLNEMRELANTLNINLSQLLAMSCSLGVKQLRGSLGVGEKNDSHLHDNQ